MTINSVDVKVYGLAVVKVSGAADFPSRISPYYYDWGDEYEPIFSTSQMAWEARKITVEFVEDLRFADNSLLLQTNPLDYLLNLFVVAPFVEVELSESDGTHGSFSAVFFEIKDHKRNKQSDKITIVFYEQVPTFVGTLPALPPLTPAIGLGGYNFSQFGILIEKISDLSAHTQAIDSAETVYLKSPKKTPYRLPTPFTVSCVCIGSSGIDALQKMNSFQKLLVSPNVLQFRYLTFAFNVFCPIGFEAKKIRQRAYRFDLKLLRL